MRFSQALVWAAQACVALAAITPASDAVPQQQERRQVDPSQFEGYLFAYFTGNTIDGEKIRFAVSNGNDALNWTELNGGKPAITSTKGTLGLRDPFIMRSHDGGTFYLIATDLSIGSGTSWGDSVKWGSRYIEVWESRDLVNWSAQRHIQVSPPEAGNTWAPEAYYDEESGQYVVFWASSLYADTDTARTGATYHRMLIATTTDFRTFSAPTIWQDAGTSRIDSTVIKADGEYFRFTKDEGAGGTGCTDIIQESSSSLRATLPSWTRVTACIGKKAGTQAVEGPTSFKANPADVNGGNKYYLFVDEYGGRGYIPLETPDIAHPNWTVSKSFKLPSSPRHGTVMPITAAEMARVRTGNVTVGAGCKKRKRQAVSKPEPQPRALAKRVSPVLPGLYADPNIAVYNRTYYIYATTDGYAGWGGNVFYVWSSPDLVEWTRSAEPILTLNGTSGNVPWADGNAWAPTITERGGKYYFYFSGNNPTYNRKTIGAAVASSPNGPFTAQSKAMILNNEAFTTGQAIDPAAFRDPTTGKYYIFWGNGNAGPLYAELAEDMVSLVPGTLKFAPGNFTDFREGVFVVYRKGLFHLNFAVDDTGSPEYRVGYSTATSVHGPWTYRGVVLRKRPELGILATGHCSVIENPGTDRWYMAYHRFHIPDGDGQHRETTIDRVYFDEVTGFMKEVIPTLESVPADPVPPSTCKQKQTRRST